jgi:UPF0176 protein
MKQLVNRINRKELKQKMAQSAEARTTISFYKYHQLSEPTQFRNNLFKMCDALGVKGRIYIAHEGINAQISLPTHHFEAFKMQLYSIDFLNNVRLNIAVEDDGKSFFVLDIKVKDKIVADGIQDPTFDPSNTGTHLNAANFNALTADPNTVLVDMRNHYESEVGHFEHAITPDVITFRDSLPIVVDMLKEQKDKNIVMYCTGGIRCEKASAYLKHNGFDNVFQLEGGIIQYAKQAKEEGLENKFKGKNFVFDERLGERIGEEVVSNCHQCGAPCDAHTNCANDACHILFLQCPSCATRYEACCSNKCKDFTHLPEEERRPLRKTEVFNGSKFSKGLYKAYRKDTFVL